MKGGRKDEGEVLGDGNDVVRSPAQWSGFGKGQ